MGMYVCSECVEKHKLNTKSFSVCGKCEVCKRDSFLVWCPDLMREFMFPDSDKVPTIEEQLKALEDEQRETNNPT
mgnify:FL=1